jgi:hypothetical protein
MIASSSTSSRRLPLDFVRGENTVESARGVEVALDVEETRALLQDVPRAYRAQINDVLLTALARSFARWTGATSLLVDLEGHGREHPFADVDVTRTVGWFTTLFPVRLELEGAAAEGASLCAVKEQLRAAGDGGFGYGLLRYMSGGRGAALDAAPRAEVCFNYLGQFDQLLSKSALFRRAARARSAATCSTSTAASAAAGSACAGRTAGTCTGARRSSGWRASFSKSCAPSPHIACRRGRAGARLRTSLWPASRSGRLTSWRATAAGSRTPTRSRRCRRGCSFTRCARRGRRSTASR